MSPKGSEPPGISYFGIRSPSNTHGTLWKPVQAKQSPGPVPSMTRHRCEMQCHLRSNHGYVSLIDASCTEPSSSTTPFHPWQLAPTTHKTPHCDESPRITEKEKTTLPLAPNQRWKEKIKRRREKTRSHLRLSESSPWHVMCLQEALSTQSPPPPPPSSATHHLRGTGQTRCCLRCRGLPNGAVSKVASPVVQSLKKCHPPYYHLKKRSHFHVIKAQTFLLPLKPTRRLFRPVPRSALFTSIKQAWSFLLDNKLLTLKPPVIVGLH